jgi:hypothetical protein
VLIVVWCLPTEEVVQEEDMEAESVDAEWAARDIPAARR